MPRGFSGIAAITAHVKREHEEWWATASPEERLQYELHRLGPDHPAYRAYEAWRGDPTEPRP